MKKYTYEVNIPAELMAGLRGVSDIITVTVESGDPGGEIGEFSGFIQQCLRDWYDSTHISLSEVSTC